MSFEQVLRYHRGVAALSRSLIGRSAFHELYVAMPDPERPEPGFIRATSWLYCLYFEAGRVSITFLRRLGEAYALMDRSSTDQHVEVVRCLRTELHHNLGFVESDQAARNVAERWRRKASGTAFPNDDQQWRKCYDCLVQEANSFLGTIDQVVRSIEAEGPQGVQRIEDWVRRLERSWPGAAFDPLVDDAKYRLGREALSTVGFRQRHLDRWRKQLDLLDEGFDFAYEATRLIEKTLLDEDSVVLPITGVDIIESLGQKPGPRVGKLLEQARKRFESAPASKEELLSYLREID